MPAKRAKQKKQPKQPKPPSTAGDFFMGCLMDVVCGQLLDFRKAQTFLEVAVMNNMRDGEGVFGGVSAVMNTPDANVESPASQIAIYATGSAAERLQKFLRSMKSESPDPLMRMSVETTRLQ